MKKLKQIIKETNEWFGEMLVDIRSENKMTIKELLARADELNIKLYPFQINRLPKGIKLWEIPKTILLSMEKSTLEKYIDGILDSQNELAGGYDGWVSGHEKLKELGFIEKRVTQGHREFVSLKFKQ